MMNSLISDANIQSTLNRLHQEARKDMPNILRGFIKSFGRKLQPQDMAKAYISISAQQGQLLYSLIRASRARKLLNLVLLLVFQRSILVQLLAIMVAMYIPQNCSPKNAELPFKILKKLDFLTPSPY